MNAIMRIVPSSWKQGEPIEKQSLLVQNESELAHHIETGLINIYSDYTHQTIEGYGCALTESACFLLSQMDDETRKKALGCWFGPNGIDSSFIRMHLDSCDYSLEEYQAVSDPIADPEFKTFSIARDLRFTIPIVLEAIKMANKKVTVLVSPWSPPAQWKTAPEEKENEAKVYGGDSASKSDAAGRCRGGRLKKEYYKDWANYLVLYLQAYKKAGIPVGMMTIQNESNAATPWDSCVWSAHEEMIFLRDYLYPAMQKAGLEKEIGIYVWDHNKERVLEYVDEMMAGGVADMIEGFAYHWYAGDHYDALTMLHEHYPDKILMRSEGCPLHKPGTDNKSDTMRYANDLTNEVTHGMNRWIEWNAIVDTEGGPRHVPGGFGAPLVAKSDGSFEELAGYQVIREFASVIQPGAVRLGSSVYSRDIDAAAAQNPDGSIGVSIVSYTDATKQIAIRLKGQICQTTIQGKGLFTVLFTDGQ